MPVIGTLPNILTNGTTADASQVMADFNFIVNQVNANANPVGTLSAPSGTRAIFNQQTAPTGWSIDATVTDHTLQLTAGAGPNVTTTGNAYSGMFNAQWTTDGHALTTAELASHNHGVNDPTHNHSSPGHSHSPASGFDFWTSTSAGGGSFNPSGGSNAINLEVQTAATAVAINLAATGISIQNNGNGNAHTHTKTFNVNYCQCIVGVKS